MADAVSIEQNNKIRAALGLKPLPVPGAQHDDDSDSSSGDEEEPGSTLESREAMASENWKRMQDEAEAKRKREERNIAIKKARDLAQRNAKLEGATLGEAETEDTKTWLMQTKKRQKKIEKERARRLAEELEERERAAEYSAADLAGIKVGHEIDDFGGGEDHILTLKDTTIDENEEEGDELENLDLREREKATERLELKKRKPAYDPTAENTGILAQYDEEIEGKKRKRFILDSKGSTAEEREAKRQEITEKLNKNVISLDLDMETPTSDYMDISEVKIKKPKKKKAKATKQRAVLDDDDIFSTPASTATPNENAMDLDSSNGQPVSAPAPRKWEDQNISLVDDDDLQASLTRQRRAAFKKRQKVRPEDIARQLREESSQTPMDTGTPAENGEEPGLVIDETSEFVSNLQKPMLPERAERQSITPAEELRAKSEGPSIKEEVEEDGDVDMSRTYNDIEDEEDLKERIKREESLAQQQISTTGLDEEATLDQGLGATLNMLKQRGLVKSSDAADHNSLLRDRSRFLQEKMRMETEAEKRARQQRERDRASGKLDRMSAREREEYARWENKQRDQQDARHMAEVFNREYKPDVQLKYVDEYGRAMNQKEAFKHLSHQFHGKGSGKMKTEKRLKKIEEEKKREAMSALDSSQHTGMNNAMGATARKNRQAGVRLG
ncbi:U4/U6-U5 snRNP complex subunit SNU66 [Aspergillus saccharolyticus JOP 1030-1]|uniref:Putative DNA binding protein SART-1 n=1 Tax=Aspergillus saccharolyticus JOP 1030-1 TaxID=1450539 RepID=A0A318ZYP4_9EURO|nr:putative DNA binding protein SART-1 [Aspergillus saccharolyticus JOP 1030-1]PYH45218.1 putative DNA binding protein SART-1 [Aspergillus saccharolyticus JOP 1030-1]